MLLRLAYLGVSNVFAMLRLLSMRERDKDMEVLARFTAPTGLVEPGGFVLGDHALLLHVPSLPAGSEGWGSCSPVNPFARPDDRR